MVLNVWVSTETAIQMQHSDEGIKLIGPSCKKLEQKWSDGQFSFVFFGNSFVFTKIGGHTTKMVRMSPKDEIPDRLRNTYNIYACNTQIRNTIQLRVLHIVGTQKKM